VAQGIGPEEFKPQNHTHKKKRLIPVGCNIFIFLSKLFMDFFFLIKPEYGDILWPVIAAFGRLRQED
jgi:hypothetical protein